MPATHLNEIDMVPVTRNCCHEFCHSEVATLTDPERRHGILIFSGPAADEDTRVKRKKMVSSRTAPVSKNARVTVAEAELDQPTSIRQYFTALEFIECLTLGLRRARETKHAISPPRRPGIPGSTAARSPRRIPAEALAQLMQHRQQPRKMERS